MVDGSMEQKANGSSFHALFSAEGTFEIVYGDGRVEEVEKGESVLIPAELGAYTLKSSLKTIILKTSMP
jgi:mannose-6-phosphate isomerase